MDVGIVTISDSAYPVSVNACTRGGEFGGLCASVESSRAFRIRSFLALDTPLSAHIHSARARRLFIQQESPLSLTHSNMPILSARKQDTHTVEKITGRSHLKSRAGCKNCKERRNFPSEFLYDLLHIYLDTALP